MYSLEGFYCIITLFTLYNCLCFMAREALERNEERRMTAYLFNMAVRKRAVLGCVSYKLYLSMKAF